MNDYIEEVTNRQSQHSFQHFGNFSKMLPEVNEDVRLGNLSVESALEAWSGVEHRFDPSPTMVVLHGSVWTNTSRPYSDIDLVIVSKSGDRIGRIPTVSNGFILDITVFPEKYILPMAEHAAKIFSRARICGFMSGCPIAGDADLFDGISTKVREIYEKRKLNTKKMLKNLEGKLFGLIMDLIFVNEYHSQRQIIKNASLIASNILSIRSCSEVFPSYILVNHNVKGIRESILELENASSNGKEDFIDYVTNNLKFSEIDFWGNFND